MRVEEPVDPDIAATVIETILVRVSIEGDFESFMIRDSQSSRIAKCTLRIEGRPGVEATHP